MTLLKMSIQAGLLITAIVIIRAIALNKLPKTSFLAMWGVALARMLVPFSFSSKWSVYSIFDGIMSGIGGGAVGAGNEVTVILDGLASPQPDITVGQNAALSLSPAITVWLVVTATLAVVFALWLLKSYRELRFAILPGRNELIDEWLSSHSLRRPLKILQSDRITMPLAIGIIRPRIILPKAMDLSDPQTVGYVLTHEYFHIRRFDMLWKLLMLCAVCIHWFNPLAWVMLVLLNRDLEITCDELVLRHFGGNVNEKKAYAYSLIGMAETRGKFSPINSYFSRNSAEERIISIMKYKKSSVLAVIVAIIMVMCLTTAFAASGNDGILQAANEAVQAADEAAHYMELIDTSGNATHSGTVTDSERYTPLKIGDASFHSETIDCVEDVSGQHTEANGRMAIYTNNGGTWALKAGQNVTLTFDIAATTNEGNGWSIYLGYGKDGIYEVCSNPRISSGETALTLTAPEDGEYSLFFVNVSAGAVYVNSCEITVD